ncbi:MAG: amino acid permease [Planctomycetaceae bacterium]|nr:amino acid permease [Planctomycetaceae bacterium]
MQDTPKRQLTLFDSTCLIVGIIIGAGIYEVAPMVAAGTSNWWGFMLIWVAGGLLSLCGALGYAELGSAYPREGGDYVYLNRAYGPWAGFLFGWIQLVVVRPGDIVGMAFIFATYAKELYDPFSGWMVPYHLLPLEVYRQADVAVSQLMYAALAVIVLTAIHVIGVREGKWTQNVLTTVKAIGLLMIVAVAFFAPADRGTGTGTVNALPMSLALILVMFTFGGWNEMAYVAAEVKDSRRNIVRALVLGTSAVTVLYLLVNGAFLYALGYEGVANSSAVATDTVSTLFPKVGAGLIAGLVCISALGATNGLIFTGARISYALGADHRPFRLLGRWNTGTGTPVLALITQAIVALVLIVVLGSFVNAILYTAAVVYSFYLATSLAVIVLRWKEPDVERPYRVSGFPVTTLIFSAVCGYLIYRAIIYKPQVAAAGWIILLVGLPIYWLSSRAGRAVPETPEKPSDQDR